MNGSGDLVLTDLHAAGSTLLLPAELDGRVYVRDSMERLVVELRKTAGDPVRLGLEPGWYRVAVETTAALRESRIELSRGRGERAPAGYVAFKREEAPARGGGLTWLPVNFSFVPPLSVNALYQFHTVNMISIDALIGYSDALEGFEVSGIGAINGDTRGIAIGGVFNWSKASLSGVQVGGAVNVAPAVIGTQIAGAVKPRRRRGRDGSPRRAPPARASSHASES